MIFAFALSFAWAGDYSVDFVQNPTGALALRGLPGYASTPARRKQPSMGIDYECLEDGLSCSVGAAAEMALHFVRLAFSTSYFEMDSLYRRIYSEVDVSTELWMLVFGGGYALSMEWIPEYEQWARHRIKLGASFFTDYFSFSALASGWSDDLRNSIEYAFGFSAKGGERFMMFTEWHGSFLDVGYAVDLKKFIVKSSYRFPGFAIALSIEIPIGSWSFEGIYGFWGESWEWYGGQISRNLAK
ncbi:MAG: hypothetical protein HUK20_11685 [Fibrobacter sp.]|nr:hypothetical protein [Fibrobacter sp.]